MKIHVIFGIDEKKFNPGNDRHVTQVLSSALAGKGIVSAQHAKKRYEEELHRNNISDEVKEKHLTAIAQINACALIYDEIWVEND